MKYYEVAAISYSFINLNEDFDTVIMRLLAKLKD